MIIVFSSVEVKLEVNLRIWAKHLRGPVSIFGLRVHAEF